MQPAEVYSLLKYTDNPSCSRILRDNWPAEKGKCKDVLALALPLKDVPITADSFKEHVNNGQDFYLTSFNIVYVDQVDGEEFGWSKAPYDNKKKINRNDQKALYTVDKDGDNVGETRFWSFKKVSNNMNKGERQDEEIDGMMTNFVLLRGTCLTTFLRQDDYDKNELIYSDQNVDEEKKTIKKYEPVLIQLSSTNSEQTVKGNGLKIRRIVPLQSNVLSSYMKYFYESKQDLQEQQDKISKITCISKMMASYSKVPLKCVVSDKAFVYEDEDLKKNNLWEIADSGLNSDVGDTILVKVDDVKAQLFTNDEERAKRFFTIALSHGAVEVLVVSSDDHEKGTCIAQFISIDHEKMLWLNTLQQTCTSHVILDLPKLHNLTMCLGNRINISSSNNSNFCDSNELKVLQWYNPSATVIINTNGIEEAGYYVFELDLFKKQTAGVVERDFKYMLMDETDGLHHPLRIFVVRPQDISINDHNGFEECTNPRLFITWQFRPGLTSANVNSKLKRSRKRMMLEADQIDQFNCGVQTDAVSETVHFQDENDFAMPKKKRTKT